MTQALVVSEGASNMAPFTLHEMELQRKLLADFVDTQLVEGTDYGVIPGAGTKRVLLQAGAEKMTVLFRIANETRIIGETEDFLGENHGGEPFFQYVAEGVASFGGRVLARRESSCNSWEVKYRYRELAPKCPACGAESIRADRQTPGKYYCWRKVGGCGAQFAPGNAKTAEIAAQPTGRGRNTDICDQLNTLRMMAQKRAFVASVRAAVGASDYFTLEDAPGSPGEPMTAPVEDEPLASVAPVQRQSTDAPTEEEEDPFDIQGIAYARSVASAFGIPLDKSIRPWLVHLNDGQELECVEGSKALTPEQWEKCFLGPGAVTAKIHSQADADACKRPATWINACQHVCGRRTVATIQEITTAEWLAIASQLAEERQ